MKKTDKTEAQGRKRVTVKPILGLFLLPISCIVLRMILDWVVTLIGEDHFGIFAPAIGPLLSAFLCLFIHRAWFAGAFDGSLKFKNCGKGLLMSLPAAVIVILNLMSRDFSKVTGVSLFNALLMGFATGMIEEVAFRGLAGSNFMRVWRDGKKIVPAVTLTAVVFGAAHLLNLSESTGLEVTLTQVCYAMGLGAIFAAVYFRTGSLIPTIIAHSLIDASCWIEEAAEGVEEIAEEAPDVLSLLVMCLVGVIMGVFGYIYISASQSAVRSLTFGLRSGAFRRKQRKRLFQRKRKQLRVNTV